MHERNETFPDVIQASLLVLALYAAECLVRAAFHDLGAVLPLNEQDLITGIVVLGNGCVFTFLMHFKNLRYRDLFHSSRNSIRATFLLLLLPIALMIPALDIIDAALNRLLVDMFPMPVREQSMFAQMLSGRLSSIVLVCFLGPILEEMLFRGIFLRSFLRQYSKWPAILWSAALFGLAHLNIYQFVGGFLSGIFLGWLYERTRSLVPCITHHCLFNLSCVIIARSSSSGSVDIYEPFGLSFLPVALICLGIGIFCLRHILRPAGR